MRSHQNMTVERAQPRARRRRVADGTWDSKIRVPILLAFAQAVAAFEIGVTHTRWDIAPWGDAASVERAEALLRERVLRYRNQHIMGWGACNPQPAPDTYDWSTLDQRIAMMRRSSATMIITLCCAPDWMKGGVAHETDWERIEVAPLPAHYDDFADLAAAVAMRYRDVLHFQVWNELKGFWNAGRNRWAYEEYTTFYNKVYAQLKAVNPAVRVGGPYPPIPVLTSPAQSEISGVFGAVDQRVLDAVRYWLANNDGADFVCASGHAARDETTGEPVPDAFCATEVLSAVTQWMRNMTTLPFWWSEFYPIPSSGEAWPVSKQVAVFRYAMQGVADAGASVALTWPAQAEAEVHASAMWTVPWTRGAMWNSTFEPHGGFASPFYEVARFFNNGTAEEGSGAADAGSEAGAMCIDPAILLQVGPLANTAPAQEGLPSGLLAGIAAGAVAVVGTSAWYRYSRRCAGSTVAPFSPSRMRQRALVAMRSQCRASSDDSPAGRSSSPGV